VRVPSRYMPSYEETLTWKSQWIGYFIITIFVGSLGYAIWDDPSIGLFFLSMIFLVSIVSLFGNDIEKQLEEKAKERKNEDIGTFASSLDYRNIDTWIIRAVYEEIQSEIMWENQNFPIRATDNLKKDLLLEDDAFDSIINCVIARVGISDKDWEKNPYYGKLETVEDMILFFNAQEKECYRCNNAKKL